MAVERDVVVLGGGLAGLSAASVLGRLAVVIERASRPGGLVQTECLAGYWFDHVIHLLHLNDDKLFGKIRAWMGKQLQPLAPEAFVVTAAGTARYPVQMHLRDLEPEAVIRCLSSLARTSFVPTLHVAANFEELLLQTVGEGLCELFLLPYHRKLWKRPLNQLATSGFQWNIAQPEFDKVLRGAISENSEYHAYNAHGWYPRPSAGAAYRGMELLSRALSAQVVDLRLRYTVTAIDLDERTVVAEHEGRETDFRFRRACCCTIPLPVAIGLCRQAPPRLREACAQLPQNRVISVALSVRGPRPAGTGLWRYYADESVIFTRLVYMHEFDPHSAPSDGWGLLVEITEPSEWPLESSVSICERVQRDLKRVNALPADGEIIDQNVIVVDPAYVVFEVNQQDVVEDARQFLRAHHVTPLGRYGCWEYSSMAQVMQAGLGWGQQLLADSRSWRRPRCGDRCSKGR